jgi:2'-5' RNA ligase
LRLFVALELPLAIRTALRELGGRLRPLAGQSKWTQGDSGHLTLKFIGEVEASKLDAIKAALALIRRPERVRVCFRGLGFFANRHRLVLFANVVESPALAGITAEMERALEPLGIPAETREYRPHVTLARIEQRNGLQELMAETRKLKASEFGSAEYREFDLMESELRPEGALHTCLERFAFAPAATAMTPERTP